MSFNQYFCCFSGINLVLLGKDEIVERFNCNDSYTLSVLYVMSSQLKGE